MTCEVLRGFCEVYSRKSANHYQIYISVHNKPMPSRNVVKIDIPNTFYHIYARGHNKNVIFRDDDDYRVFLNLLKRYLNIVIEKDSSGRPYANLHDQIKLNCYCLMPNHFHLLIYQINEHAMSQLMKFIMVSYSRYFNKNTNYRVLCLKQLTKHQ